MCIQRHPLHGSGLHERDAARRQEDPTGRPGQQFKNLLEDAEFNLVASRSAQAAVIKAIREGKTNVDLNIPETPDGGGDGDGTTGGGTQSGGSNAGGSGTTGTEGSGTQGAGGSGTTGDQGTSGGNTGSEGGGDNVSL